MSVYIHTCFDLSMQVYIHTCIGYGDQCVHTHMQACVNHTHMQACVNHLHSLFTLEVSAMLIAVLNRSHSLLHVCIYI